MERYQKEKKLQHFVEAHLSELNDTELDAMFNILKDKENQLRLSIALGNVVLLTRQQIENIKACLHDDDKDGVIKATNHIDLILESLLIVRSRLNEEDLSK